MGVSRHKHFPVSPKNKCLVWDRATRHFAGIWHSFHKRKRGLFTLASRDKGHGLFADRDDPHRVTSWVTDSRIANGPDAVHRTSCLNYIHILQIFRRVLEAEVLWAIFVRVPVSNHHGVKQDVELSARQVENPIFEMFIGAVLVELVAEGFCSCDVVSVGIVVAMNSVGFPP